MRVSAAVNTNPPFGNLDQDVLTFGLEVRLASPAVDLTLSWQAADCRVRSTRRGPRISCSADDAGKRKILLRPTSTPNLFDMKLLGRRLDFPPPLTADPVTVTLLTASFLRTDVIAGCDLRGRHDQIESCGESGFVPTLTPTPTHTPLGDRVFSIARPGSKLLTSILPGIDVSLDPWLPGPLRLSAGSPDANGVAPLTLAQDVIYGAQLLDGSTFCVKLFAAGSTGSIDCDGGSPHDMLDVLDRSAGSTEVETSGLGGDGGPGAASISFYNDPHQLGSGTTVADCLSLFYTPRYLTTYTTTTATGRIIAPFQGGGDIEISASGENFDCASWQSEDGPGVLLNPISAYNGLVGDVMTIAVLSDAPVLPPTPTLPPGRRRRRRARPPVHPSASAPSAFAGPAADFSAPMPAARTSASTPGRAGRWKSWPVLSTPTATPRSPCSRTLSSASACRPEPSPASGSRRRPAPVVSLATGPPRTRSH